MDRRNGEMDYLRVTHGVRDSGWTRRTGTIAQGRLKRTRGISTTGIMLAVFEVQCLSCDENRIAGMNAAGFTMNNLRQQVPRDLSLPVCRQLNVAEIDRIVSTLARQVRLRHKHEVGGLWSAMAAQSTTEIRRAIVGGRVTTSCRSLSSLAKSRDKVLVVFHFFGDAIEISAGDIGVLGLTLLDHLVYREDAFGFWVCRPALDSGWLLQEDLREQDPSFSACEWRSLEPA